MEDEDKIEDKYSFIKPNAQVYVMNDFQESIEVDNKNDQPYIEATIQKIHRQSQEVDVFLTENQKNITVRFDSVLPVPNILLLKKIDNLTDYYLEINYLVIQKILETRFRNKKYFTKISSKFLINIDPYHSYNVLEDKENIYEKINPDFLLSLKKRQTKKSSKKTRDSKVNLTNILSSETDLNYSMRLKFTEGDKLFDEFIENKDNMVYIFKGEMYSNKFLLLEKLLSKLLPEKLSNDTDNTFQNMHESFGNSLQTFTNMQSTKTNKFLNNSQENTVNINNLDTKIFAAYKLIKMFGCILENCEILNDDLNKSFSSVKDDFDPKIVCKYLLRINLQYDGKKIIGGEFSPYLFCECNLKYILTHAIFYTIINIDQSEKLYNDLFLQDIIPEKNKYKDLRSRLTLIPEKIKNYINKEFNLEPLLKYFSILNFNNDEINSILSICASLLYINKFKFMISNSDYLTPENEEIINILSKLLKIKEENLTHIFFHKKVKSSNILKINDLNEFEINKNSICKKLYVSLFNWIVMKINIAIKNENFTHTNNIGNNIITRNSGMSFFDSRKKSYGRSSLNDWKKNTITNFDLFGKYQDDIKVNEDDLYSKKETKAVNDNDDIDIKKLSPSKLIKEDPIVELFDLNKNYLSDEMKPHDISIIISPGFRLTQSKLCIEEFLSNYINEKIIFLYNNIIYQRKINKLKDEGLEDFTNNIFFNENANILEIYELDTFNILKSINDFCVENPPHNLEKEINIFYNNLSSKFHYNDVIEFNSKEKLNFRIIQTEGEAKYNIRDLIQENYNDICSEVYKILFTSTNNIFSLIILGILKEDEILNSKDNLFDEFAMSSELPRKRTMIINNFMTVIKKIFENLDVYEFVSLEEEKKFNDNKYKFILCLKSNNEYKEETIYPRYLFSQLINNDLLNVINFYKNHYEIEITYENFVNKIFKKISNDIVCNIKDFKDQKDNKVKTKQIINLLLNKKISKNYVADEIDLTKQNYILGKTKIFLQTHFYNHLLYKMNILIENKKSLILKLLGHLEGFIFRTKFNNYIKTILATQSYYRKFKKDLREKIKIQKVIQIQSALRKAKHRIKYLKLKHNTILIQKNFRRAMAIKKILNIRHSVHVLYPPIKYFLTRLKIKNIKLEEQKKKQLAFEKQNQILRESIATKLNAIFRKILFRIHHPKLMNTIKEKILIKKYTKSALIIQRYYRFYSTFTKFHFKKMAADFIRGYWRMKKSVNYINRLYQSVIPLQRNIRQYLATKNAFTIATKNYMEQSKFSSFQKAENKSITKYFSIMRKEFLGMSNKNVKKSFNQKVTFFTEINDIDVYNSTYLTYSQNNKYKCWIEKFYRMKIIDKELFGETSSFMNIKASGYHTCLMNSKGKIYSFGWNDKGQCDVDTVSTDKKSISNLTFSQVECARTKSYLLTNKNELSIGLEIFSDFLVDGITTNHSNSIYAWKDNIYYKITGENVTKMKININIKKKSIIKKISCGKNFVQLLSDNGLLFSFGNNSKGELGLRDFIPRSRPTLNEIFCEDGERITDISCGYKHCLALGANGKVFTWGCNSNGQCGMDIKSNIHTPMYMDSKKKFLGIVCGFRCSFFMDEQRILYFCGRGGVNNGEVYNIKKLKNIIGKEKEYEYVNNNINNLNNNFNNININNNGNNNFLSGKKKNSRCSSALSNNKNNLKTIVSCINNNVYPVKLNCSWNDSFSIMYVTYADTTNLINNAYKKELDKKQVKSLLDKLTLNWINNNTNIKKIMKDCKEFWEYI